MSRPLVLSRPFNTPQIIALLPLATVTETTKRHRQEVAGDSKSLGQQHIRGNGAARSRTSPLMTSHQSLQACTRLNERILMESRDHLRKTQTYSLSETVFLLLCLSISLWGTGMAQWLEHRTRDRKVPGSSTGRIGGKIFFSRVNFLSSLVFRYPFHTRITAVARKRCRSLCQKCRWQVTPTTKHTRTLPMWLQIK